MISRFLRQLVDEPDRGPGRLFAWFIQVVIVVSILDFTIETIPSISPQLRSTLRIIEVTTIVIFSLEFVLRIGFSRKGFRYIFSFYGVIDLLAILPFYLSLGIDLRSVRAFRLLRLFHLLKLTRYSRAIQRYRFAFQHAREELLLFGATSLIILFVAAVGIHYFESAAQPELFGSIPSCLWWAVTSLTTVGYGDSYPVTAGGKLFTFVILAVGLAIVAVPSGIMASALSEARKEVKEPQSESNNNSSV